MKTEKGTFKANLDLVGMMVSIACAIHCAMLPILVTLGTLGALSFLTSPVLEPIVIALSCIIAIVSLLPTYLKHRSQPLPLIIMIIGLCLVVASRFENFEAIEIQLTVSGAVSIALAHLINWRYLLSLKK
ncbi:MAG: MerC domain-containing protein [Bacteroidota bacterium]